MRTLVAAIVVGTLTSASAVLAQAPAAPAATPGTASGQIPSPQADTFTYDPEGRRDPFVSLTSRGTEHAGGQPGQELDGVRALGADEISVRGIVATGSGYVAIVRGPSGKTFLVHQDDKLLDGTVKTITAQAIVIMQDVNDPLSLVKQKEVRKLLRGTEEGK